jgi:hypothetical protein
MKWNLKQSCSPGQDLPNNMWHATHTHTFQGDFQLLIGRSKIGILTPITSFGHNSCFKYSNGSYESILNIYVSRTFQWYKELFNPMCFDPWNTSLKIQDSIGIPTPKVDSGVHSRVCRFTFGSANVTPKLHFQPAPFHAFALVTSPKPKSWQLHYRIQNQHGIKLVRGYFGSCLKKGLGWKDT